ncbi:unnamed protein product [Prunus armeniaca]|uniref:Uncharacterized protein n=1 Tax=Prunus armeniaca TaxID=36596 RepID=A0A6J5UFI0_PRUAR|nr:unnamed protein product [Prunus armeniaca]
MEGRGWIGNSWKAKGGGVWLYWRERERKRERTTLAVGSGWIDEGLSKRKGGWGLAGWDDGRRLVGRQAMVEVPERDGGGTGWIWWLWENGGCGRLGRRRVASAGRPRHHEGQRYLL